MSFHKQQKLPYMHLSRSRGLPTGQVQNIAITNDGGIWIATPAGLAHYDGIRINNCTQKDGLGTHGLRTVYSETGDQLLVGTDIGLDQRIPDTEKFEALISPENWKHGLVECVLSNEDGTYWIGTPSGLYLHSPKVEGINTHLYLQGFVKQLLRTANGKLWILGKPFGLTILDDKRVRSETIPSLFALKTAETICLTEDSRHLLVGGPFGVSLIDEEGGSIQELIGPMPEKIVTSLFSYKDEIWMGTNRGLYLFAMPNETNEFISPDPELILPGYQISTILADETGNIWVGSDNNGAFKFSFIRDICVEYNFPELDSVFSIRERKFSKDNETEYLLASQTGVFCFNKRDGVSRFHQLGNFYQHVWDVLEIQDDKIWLATETGLYLYDEQERVRKIGRDHPVCRSPNRVLLETSDGSVYLGTQSGLALVTTTGIISEITDSRYSSLGYVYCLEPTENGLIFIGTIGNGLWYGNINGVKRLTSQFITKKDNVYSICAHSNGDVAILCNNKIIIRSAQGNERILYQAMRSIIGWTVKWESDKHIWVGSSEGLFEINVETGEVIRNLRALPGSEVLEFNCSESLVIGKNGEFLCGVRGNFTLVDSQRLRIIRKKPHLSLKKSEWINAGEYYLSNQLIKEGKWSLLIKLQSHWFMDAEMLLFRYRLIGFDKNWSETKKVSDIRFNSLPSGKYTLLVQANSPLFGWGDSTEIFDFEVAPSTQFGNVISRVLKPVFTLTQNIKWAWRNLSLQKQEREVNELVRSKLSEAEQDKLELQREKKELEKRSNIDSLTGVANRRAFDDFLRNAMDIAASEHSHLSLILLDIDHFKGFNDTYGHIAGDDALRQVSGLIHRVMRRSGDFLARYGGEEFAIILPTANIDNAQALAERINDAIWAEKIEHIGQPNFKRLTSSMGVVSVNFADVRNLKPRDLIFTTDKNLYKAKETGKNRYIATEYGKESVK